MAGLQVPTPTLGRGGFSSVTPADPSRASSSPRPPQSRLPTSNVDGREDDEQSSFSSDSDDRAMVGSDAASPNLAPDVRREESGIGPLPLFCHEPLGSPTPMSPVAEGCENDGMFLSGSIPRRPSAERILSGDSKPIKLGRAGSFRRPSMSSSASTDSSHYSVEKPALRRQITEMHHWWKYFSLFGINRQDDTPRVWGKSVTPTTRRGSTGSVDGPVPRQAATLARVVRQHTFGEEMKLQLRDERIELSYTDAFEADELASPKFVRVFSPGATLLEYLKIFLGVWCFFMAFLLVAFWEVLHRHKFLLIDAAADLMYAVCLVLQLRTTILNVGTGKEYCNKDRILRANLRNKWFWIDTASCVPLILLENLTTGSDIVRWFSLVKALRGWRIYRVPPEHRFLPSATFQIGQLLGALLMGGHFLACLWFLVVFYEEDAEGKKNIFKYYMPEDEPDFLDLYAICLYAGVYLLLGIDRDAYSTLEHFFITVCAPIGALVHAYILGKIILLIQRFGALETAHNEHAMAVQEAMRILGLDPRLQMRVIAFFTYERIHRGRRLFDALFADLSSQLKFELQLHLYLDLVGKSGLFRTARPKMIREIVIKLEDVIFLPGDWVCRFGDYGNSMYFMIKGECEVIAQDTETRLKFLSRGDYFGEVALLTGVPRTAFVRANKFCIMAELTKEGFAPILRMWPDEMDVLIKGIKKEDREKIKAEASKLYKLRRPSQLSIGGNLGFQGDALNQRRRSLSRDCLGKLDEQASGARAPGRFQQRRMSGASIGSASSVGAMSDPPNDGDITGVHSLGVQSMSMDDGGGQCSREPSFIDGARQGGSTRSRTGVALASSIGQENNDVPGSVPEIMRVSTTSGNEGIRSGSFARVPEGNSESLRLSGSQRVQRSSSVGSLAIRSRSSNRGVAQQFSQVDDGDNDDIHSALSGAGGTGGAPIQEQLGSVRRSSAISDRSGILQSGRMPSQVQPSPDLARYMHEQTQLMIKMQAQITTLAQEVRRLGDWGGEADRASMALDDDSTEGDQDWQCRDSVISAPFV